MTTRQNGKSHSSPETFVRLYTGPSTQLLWLRSHSKQQSVLSTGNFWQPICPACLWEGTFTNHVRKGVGTVINKQNKFFGALNEGSYLVGWRFSFLPSQIYQSQASPLFNIPFPPSSTHVHAHARHLCHHPRFGLVLCSHLETPAFIHPCGQQL